jgi:hypothetical protein
VYVNDKVIVLDRDTITASELLEMAGFSSLVYDLYLIPNNEKEKKKSNKQLIENREIKIEQDCILTQISNRINTHTGSTYEKIVMLVNI